MNKIISKEYFSANVVKFDVEAPLIAKARKAGHFVIVRTGEKGERIPLTITSSDPERGTISLVIQAVGKSTRKLCSLVEAMKKAGNRVITVLAARTKELIILEEQVRPYSDEVIIMTDDGSYGKKGLVTHGVEEVINREKVDLCVTIGPAIMMKFVSLLTKKYDIPTMASLNTIMVDGTGMCGACRVTVGGKTKFVCVDGPEFDAHQVDFDEMLMRLSSYKGIE